MPKIKVRIAMQAMDGSEAVLNGQFIVEAPSPISAMAKFSAAANTMPYTGPVTNEPAGDPSGKDS